MTKGALYRDHGIVLRTYKLGEADRIVVIITERHGKVRAVAKGVRKTRSKFGSRLEPMSHSALQLYEGRELDVVTQAVGIDHFRPIREDLDRYGRAMSMLEAVDQMAMERESSSRHYQMLLGGLRTLAAADSPVMLGAFYWKLLTEEGFGPHLDACSSCGEDAELVAFDLNEGGTLCRSCRSGFPLSLEALELMRMILGGRLNEALAQPASPAAHEVEQLATRAMEHHLERRLRSVGVVDLH